MSDEGSLWERVLRRLGHDDLADVAREMARLAARRSKLRSQIAKLEMLGRAQDPLTTKLRGELGRTEGDHDAARRLLLGEDEP